MGGDYIDINDTNDHFQKYSKVKSNLLLENNDEHIAPFFSVIIPTYGRPSTLSDTLNSVMNQVDFTDFEVLVLDDDPEHFDGSSKRIAEEFHDSRIKYYLHEKNLGQCGNWNKGVELSKGEYIIIVHDDDVISPYHMKCMHDFLSKSVYGVIGVRNCNFSGHLPKFEPPNTKIRFNSIKLDDFFWGRYFGIAGMTWNRQFALDIGGYSETDYPMHDSIFILKAIMHGQVFLIDEILSGYRIGINVSLKPETMHAVIEGFHLARKAIASVDSYHGMIMKRSERQLLTNYMNSANKTWGYNWKMDDFEYLLDGCDDANKIGNLTIMACSFLEKVCFKLRWRRM